MAREAIAAAPSGLTHGPGMSIGVKAGGFIFLSPIRGNDAGPKLSFLPGRDRGSTMRVAVGAKECDRWAR